MDAEFNTKILYDHIKTQTDVKTKSREKIYNKVLEKIQRKIFKASSSDIFTILYEIPKFIIGEPLYSISKCAEYIAYNLGSNGFKIKLFDKKELKEILGIKRPQSPVILISWEHLKYNQQFHQQPNQPLNQQINNQINNGNYNGNYNENKLIEQFKNINLTDNDSNKYIYINNKYKKRN